MWGVFHGPEGPRFHRYRKGRMCRAYGARDSTALFPRPAGRGYLLPPLWRSDRRVPILTGTATAHAFTGTANHRDCTERSLGSSLQRLARDCDPDRIPGCQRAMRRSSREPGRTERPTTGRESAPTHANLFWDRCLLWKLRMPVGNRARESYSGARGSQAFFSG
jgi:hypothetical protein